MGESRELIENEVIRALTGAARLGGGWGIEDSIPAI